MLTDRFREARAPLALAGGGAAAVVAYPFATEAVLAAWGPRAVALGLVAAGLAGAALRHRFLPRAPVFGPAPQLALVALAGLAALLDARWPLLFVPALVFAHLAAVVGRSTREPLSLVERGALWMEPKVPEFVGPYCRRLTALLAAFFAANALAIAALAAAAPLAWWRAWTGAGVWLVTALLLVVEYPVRKIHFRYYHGGPLDPLFAALFPAENTPRGRRSAELIRRAREDLAAGGDGVLRGRGSVSEGRAGSRESMRGLS